MNTASPMVSQLKSSFTSPITRGPLSFTIKVIQSEKPTYQVIRPINGDPFIGSLETPVTSKSIDSMVPLQPSGLLDHSEPSTAPLLTLTGWKKEPDQLQTADGWAKFTGGFFFGGISGVTLAYFLLYVLNLPCYFK
ncbi:hypothetical protein SLE2022_131950 [Rubroshorea leprosula]